MAEDDNTIKYKWWQKVLLIIGDILAVAGISLFFLSSHTGTINADYTKKQELPAPLQGTISLALSGQYPYAYCDFNCSLNAFDVSDGSFCYSISIPHHQNGESEFYIRNGYIILWDRIGTLYKYNQDGTFLGKAYFDNSQFVDERDCLYLNGSDDTLLEKIPAATEGIPYNCLDFDDESIIYNAWDKQKDKDFIVTYNFLTYETSAREYNLIGDDQLKPVRALEGNLVFPSQNPIYDDAGHEYSVSFGKLYKDDQVLYKTPLLDRLKGPLVGWYIAAVGIGIAAIIVSVHDKKRAKQENVKDKELLRSFLPKSNE